MIDISFLLEDPDFVAAVPLSRDEGDWEKGRFVHKRVPMTILASVQPAASEDVVMTPQGNQINCDIAVYSASPILTTRQGPAGGEEKGTADEIQWRGEWYVVRGVEEWSDSGSYKALCTRKAGY